LSIPSSKESVEPLPPGTLRHRREAEAYLWMPVSDRRVTLRLWRPHYRVRAGALFCSAFAAGKRSSTFGRTVGARLLHVEVHRRPGL